MMLSQTTTLSESSTGLCLEDGAQQVQLPGRCGADGPAGMWVQQATPSGALAGSPSGGLYVEQTFRVGLSHKSVLTIRAPKGKLGGRMPLTYVRDEAPSPAPRDWPPSAGGRPFRLPRGPSAGSPRRPWGPRRTRTPSAGYGRCRPAGGRRCPWGRCPRGRPSLSAAAETWSA